MALGDNGAAPPLLRSRPSDRKLQWNIKKNENENVEGKKKCNKKKTQDKPLHRESELGNFNYAVGGGEGCVVLADQRDKQFY